jgi:hypothetical protein
VLILVALDSYGYLIIGRNCGGFCVDFGLSRLVIKGWELLIFLGYSDCCSWLNLVLDC